MSRIIHLGTFRGAEDFNADLDIVLRSNVLAQANSGGGKSWLLRRFAEQAFTKVPQIIIDPEGEFSTLREKFDFVLVGKGGDTPADIRSAPLLAHRLLELGASAIVDLFEMSKTQRPAWVAVFVQALVDAPKKLWRDLLIHIDESHELAPEPGHGVHESGGEKLCRSALIDLAAKGRKRGYGVCAYTQRLGKLSKDFAAELKNVLIGQTFIDIDRERAAGNLGIAKADKLTFSRDVKNLPPGNFYALGRAFVLEPTLVRIGKVVTEHPTPGKRQAAPPPPTAKIKHMLPQLADLPAEAEQKLKTEAELRARIAELEKATTKQAPAPTKTVEKPVLKEADHTRLEKLVVKLCDAQDAIGVIVKEGRETASKLVDTLAQRQQVLTTEIGNLRTLLGRTTQIGHTVVPVLNGVPDTGRRHERQPAPTVKWRDDAGVEALPAVTQRMIGALRQGEAMGYTSMLFKNVAHIAGVSPTSGTTSNRKGMLTGGGYITSAGPFVSLTDKGRAYPIDVELPPTDTAGLLAFWKREIGTDKVCRILDVVVSRGRVSNADLAEAVEMAADSGTFSNYKGVLTGRGLITKSGRDYVPAEVFTR